MNLFFFVIIIEVYSFYNLKSGSLLCFMNGKIRGEFRLLVFVYSKVSSKILFILLHVLKYGCLHLSPRKLGEKIS